VLLGAGAARADVLPTVSIGYGGPTKLTGAAGLAFGGDRFPPVWARAHLGGGGYKLSAGTWVAASFVGEQPSTSDHLAISGVPVTLALKASLLRIRVPRRDPLGPRTLMGAEAELGVLLIFYVNAGVAYPMGGGARKPVWTWGAGVNVPLAGW
jgi:hypothetical protein